MKLKTNAILYYIAFSPPPHQFDSFPPLFYFIFAADVATQ